VRQPPIDPQAEQQRQAAEAQAQEMAQHQAQQQLHLEREHEEQLLLSLAARELLPAEAPEPQGRNPGVIAGIGIAMLAIGAAVGWFGYSVLTDDDDAIAQVVDADSTDAAFGQLNGTLAETSSATTGTTTAIPAATIASSVWAHPDGTLQANLPDDWVPSWQSRPWPEEGIEASILRSTADPVAAAQGNHDPFMTGSIFVGRYTRTGITPTELLGLLGTQEGCASKAPAEPFDSGGKTGLIVRLTECGTVAGHAMQIALQDGNDAVQYMTLRAPSAGALESYRGLMLSAATSPTGAPANVPGERTCVYSSPSANPDFPFVVSVSNLTEGPITWYALDPATGAPSPDGRREEFGPNTARSNTFKGGVVIRIERPAGNLDFTVAADPIQCVNVTDQGLEPG
jgi:hypothetical protein